MAQGISAQVVRSQRKTIITLGFDLYERAIKLQKTSAISDWLLRVGELHAYSASMHAIGIYCKS